MKRDRSANRTALSERISALQVLDQVLSIAPGATRDRKREILRAAVEPDAEAAPTGAGLVLRPDGSFGRIEAGDVAGAHPFIPDAEIRDCFAARFGEYPTAAELMLLKVLLSGGTLRDASRQDGRSYETKRNQLASLRARTGLSSQSELLQVVAVLLANAARRNRETPAEQTGRLQKLMARYYAPDQRLHRMTLSSRRELIVADIGPIGGQPFVLFHPSAFPLVPSPHRAAVLSEHGLRVLVPIRPGYYGAVPSSEVPEVARDAFVADCIEFLHVFRLENVPLVSHSSGVVSALAVAERLGPACAGLILSSPQYFAAPDDATASQFTRGWAHLARNFHHLIAPTFATLGASLHVMTIARRILRTAYQTSRGDLDDADEWLAAEWFHDVLRNMVEVNQVGTRADMQLMGEDWPARLATLKCRVTALYGETDPFSNRTLVQARLDAAGGVCEVLPGFGQNTILQHPEMLFRAGARS